MFASSKAKGYLAFVLHAHLPFIRHPEYDNFLEEDWLFEAISETYIPLLMMLDNLWKDNIPCRLTLSLSPTLLEMLTDPLLQGRYVRYLEQRIALGEKEKKRLASDEELLPQACYYFHMYSRCLDLFIHRYSCDLTTGFFAYQKKGYLDLMTCGATHGFFPSMVASPSSTNAQVYYAKHTFEHHFNFSPQGFWIPECAYFPGHDHLLKKHNFRFFIVDTHAVSGSQFSQYSQNECRFGPVQCEKSGVIAFARDNESSQQVWSADLGYPGDEWYREFYRDIGYDCSSDYIKDYICDDGHRKHTGYKYYRISNKQGDHEVYQPAMADQKAWEHAGNFVFNRALQIKDLGSKMSLPPIVTAPYDAELFGHWWFEGPRWLEYVFRRVHEQESFQIITHGDYLDTYCPSVIAEPGFSTWGDGGYAKVWVNPKNDWIYKHLYVAGERMHLLAKTFPSAQGQYRRALNQAARELLLAQSSDWSFIMTTETTVPYAIKRFREHINRFTTLYTGLMNHHLDIDALSRFEQKDNLFADIDYRIYAS